MQRFRQAITTTGAQQPFIADYKLAPFSLSWVLDATGLTINYKVQYTYDDLNANPAIATPLWLDDSVAGAGTTATKDNSYNHPISAIRVNITSISGGSGTAYFTVLQGDRDSAN